MISFDALPGNRSLKASLRRALAGRIPQTVLLSGDDTRGLETLSTVLAAGILCEADGPRPCGACLSCRKVQDGVHPDLTLIDEVDGLVLVTDLDGQRTRRDRKAHTVHVKLVHI